MNLIVPKDLIGLLGTFWTRIVARPRLSERLTAGLLANHYQSEQKATELVKSVSNLEIPAGQTTTFEKFTFVRTGRSTYEYSDNPNIKYDRGIAYGLNIGNESFYKLDNDIIAIPTMYDDPVNPTKTYTENVDYRIEPGKIIFRIPMPSSTDLYARKVIRDTGFVFRQLSYVIGVNLSDSVFRKIPLAELWRLFSYGPNYYNVMRLLSICAGAPIIKHEKEVIQSIHFLFSGGRLVITDKETYWVPPKYEVTARVNQTLNQGTSISSGLKTLHDKRPIIYVNDSDNKIIGTSYKYGNKTINPSKLILLKADIQGPEVVALKYLTSVLPLDVKLLILANTTVPKTNITNFSFNTLKGGKSVAVPKYAISEVKVTVKCGSSLKYSFYGF